MLPDQSLVLLLDDPGIPGGDDSSHLGPSAITKSYRGPSSTGRKVNVRVRCWPFPTPSLPTLSPLSSTVQPQNESPNYLAVEGALNALCLAAAFSWSRCSKHAHGERTADEPPPTPCLRCVETADLSIPQPPGVLSRDLFMGASPHRLSSRRYLSISARIVSAH